MSVLRETTHPPLKASINNQKVSGKQHSITQQDSVTWLGLVGAAWNGVQQMITFLHFCLGKHSQRPRQAQKCLCFLPQLLPNPRLLPWQTHWPYIVFKRLPFPFSPTLLPHPTQMNLRKMTRMKLQTYWVLTAYTILKDGESQGLQVKRKAKTLPLVQQWEQPGQEGPGREWPSQAREGGRAEGWGQVPILVTFWAAALAESLPVCSACWINRTVIICMHRGELSLTHQHPSDLNKQPFYWENTPKHTG